MAASIGALLEDKWVAVGGVDTQLDVIYIGCRNSQQLWKKLLESQRGKPLEVKEKSLGSQRMGSIYTQKTPYPGRSVQKKTHKKYLDTDSYY